MAIKLEKRPTQVRDKDVRRTGGEAGAGIGVQQLPQSNVLSAVRTNRPALEVFQNTTKFVGDTIQALETERQKNLDNKYSFELTQNYEKEAANLAGFTGNLDDFETKMAEIEKRQLQTIKEEYDKNNDKQGYKYFLENGYRDATNTYRYLNRTEYFNRIKVDTVQRLDGGFAALDIDLENINSPIASVFFETAKAQYLNKHKKNVDDSINFKNETVETVIDGNRKAFEKYIDNNAEEDELGLTNYDKIAAKVNNKAYTFEKENGAPEYSKEEKQKIRDYVNNKVKEYNNLKTQEQERRDTKLTVDTFKRIEKFFLMPEGEAKEIERQALQNFIFGVKGNAEEFPTIKSRFLGKDIKGKAISLEKAFENASTGKRIEQSDGNIYRRIWDDINAGKVKDVDYIISTTFGDRSIVSLVNDPNGISYEDYKIIEQVVRNPAQISRLAEQESDIKKLVKGIQDKVLANIPDTSRSEISLDVEYQVRKYIRKKLADNPDLEVVEMFDTSSELYPDFKNRISAKDIYNDSEAYLRREIDSKIRQAGIDPEESKGLPEKLIGVNMRQYNKKDIIKQFQNGDLDEEALIDIFGKDIGNQLIQEAQ